MVGWPLRVRSGMCPDGPRMAGTGTGTGAGAVAFAARAPAAGRTPHAATRARKRTDDGRMPPFSPFLAGAQTHVSGQRHRVVLPPALPMRNAILARSALFISLAPACGGSGGAA